MIKNKFIIKYLVTSILVTVFFLAGYFLSLKINTVSIEDVNVFKKRSRSLDRYSIENLGSADFKTGTIEIGQNIDENNSYESKKFVFHFIPEITGNSYKKTSGIINIPKSDESKKWPLVVLIRGYVDQKSYTSGDGSRNIGIYLANRGFLTISPDFLGYGDSDGESGNIFETRFQTYTTTISLIRSIENGILNKYWDGKNIFIWGHSNGGQITLITLEAIQKNYPAVLWAPVTKPFPYSILYYTDESQDKGKLIRTELSKFEKTYDVEKYSLTNYIDRIKSPIQLHQGTADDAVPVSWSDTIVAKMKSVNIDVEYIKHIGADHNIQPDWENAAKQSIDFYTRRLL